MANSKQEEQLKKKHFIEKRLQRMDELLLVIESDTNEDWDANPGYQKLRLEIARCKNMIEEMKQNPSLLL